MFVADVRQVVDFEGEISTAAACQLAWERETVSAGTSREMPTLPTTTARHESLTPHERDRFSQFEQHLQARWTTDDVFGTVASALPLLVPDAVGAVYTWAGPERVGRRAGSDPAFSRRLDELPLARLRRYDPTRPDASANRAVRLEDLYRGDAVGHARYLDEIGRRLAAERVLRVLLYDGMEFVAWVGLLRRETQPSFDLRDVALLQRAVPLLHGTLASSQALTRRRPAGQGLPELVEAMQEAVVVVCGAGVPIYLNAPARRRFPAPPEWVSRCGDRAGRGGLPVGVRQIPVDVGGHRVYLVIPEADRAGVAPDGTREVQWQRRVGLSPSLARVASLMVEGYTDREISDRLGLKFNSVRTYARRIYAQTGARNRVELARLAARSGAVDWRV